ncbi:hypothetical protein [Marinithermofilum abyssi]|nr:hypothetical protein [Marinithermofilum abyssi]
MTEKLVHPSVESTFQLPAFHAIACPKENLSPEMHQKAVCHGMIH